MTRAPPIGALRTRLMLEAPLDLPDDTGAFARTWSPVGRLWGRVAPRRGDANFTAAQSEVAITHEVTIRARDGVADGMRFRIGARALLIRAVLDPEGRGRVLQCACEEFAP